MRISDWSSDVCSSDLRDVELIAQRCCALGRFADAFMPGRNRRQGGRERCREVDAGLSHASVVHTELAASPFVASQHMIGIVEEIAVDLKRPVTFIALRNLVE